MGLYSGCSSNPPANNNADAAVCHPSSDDPSGCPCNSTYQPTACYSGPVGSEAHGICQAGMRSCMNGVLTGCVGEVTPQLEVCNLRDDDCNGLIDDVPGVVDAAVLTNCTSPACTLDSADAAITCWGPDNGICGAGVKSCAPGAKGGTPTGCNEFIHGGAMEVCNGLDDDCNGIIDDGLNNDGPCTIDPSTPWSNFPDADLTNLGFVNGADAGPQPTNVLGECGNGNLTCTDTDCPISGPNVGKICFDAGDQCMPQNPVQEVCNGKDDDCNGLVDDHACASAPPGQAWCCMYGSTGYCESGNFTGSCTYAK